MVLSSAHAAEGASRFCTAPLMVLVTHTNELIRRGVGAMIASIGPAVTASEASTYADAERQVRQGQAQVLILPCQPYDASRRLADTAAAAGVKVLVLLHDPDPDHLALAAELTVDGFLLSSDLTADSLEAAVTRLEDGEMLMPSTLVKKLVSELRNRSPARRDPRPLLLTPREHQTLELLTQGLGNKQIARRLGIREHGAKRHVANVLAKLNCPNRTLAVAQALRDGLIEPQTPPADSP
ncbi:helix-turn-helix transcriptional regulator [Nonomuraea sediminis]|uniref:helix-turn-helix transcriptional regulator n=1 Tax=Nonomuraea sediminis TaxID=2835864 RepID=UPI001BDCBE4C|nr:response regulator transcription factor [Nonomuraea sediminis]